MVSTNSEAPTNRQELLERTLAIISPLLKYLDVPLDRDFRGIALKPVLKGSRQSGLALARDGRLYRALPDTKNPWREAKEIPFSDFRYGNVFEDTYRSLISVLLAKAGQKMEHAVAIQERLAQIRALVREYAFQDLPAGPLVSWPPSITNVSFALKKVRYSDGSEEIRLSANFSALCPLRRSGCNGFVRLEDVIIATDSVLGEKVMLFTPTFIKNDSLRHSMPFYCNAQDCGCAFGLSHLNIAEVIEESKNFLRSKGYGFEPI